MRAGQQARRGMAAVLLAVAALLAAGCSGPARSSSSGPGLISGQPGGNAVALLTLVKTASAGPVLASGTGYTLYWFSQDAGVSSACTSLCVPQWPPLTGAPRAAKGTSLPGRLGTITRPDGTVQATYDGHPLYTFAGDFEPGDVGGDKVVQFGGTWHAVRP